MCLRPPALRRPPTPNSGVRRSQVPLTPLVAFLHKLFSAKGSSIPPRDRLFLRKSFIFIIPPVLTHGFRSSISQHHYSGSFCSGNEGLLQDLMTKATVRGNLTIFAPDAKAVRAQGLDYVLGETNSYSCHVRPSMILVSLG